ncbi:GNAT family N-acetyltransferase [Lewinellaceae bacterium SD302]|nr:GNAT family N-acetyltransferase [Lewinellaceae bacterium SD302]
MIDWTTKSFQQLTVAELYELLALRAEVFVVEQDCVYQDLDGKDQESLHLLGYENGQLIAYARILDKGLSYPDYASIGRVVTSPAARGRAIGYELMREADHSLVANYGAQSVKISAQAHLQGFYGKLGYVGVGEEYLEDGIPHRAMVK